MRGVLFDIDGTLLGRSSAHLPCLVQAVNDAFGATGRIEMQGERPFLDGRDVAGWTDAQVMRSMLAAIGRADDLGSMPPLMDSYATRFESALAEGASPGIVLPGVEDSLRRLATAGVQLGLVTGNAARVAEAKLRRVGLAAWFAFDGDAGFGDWREDRAALVPAALAALDLPASLQVALVGDTAADVGAARRSQLFAVGVETGAASAEELEAAGAFLVVSDLRGFYRALMTATGARKERCPPGRALTVRDGVLGL